MRPGKNATGMYHRIIDAANPTGSLLFLCVISITVENCAR